jgi:hypothetical protein
VLANACGARVSDQSGHGGLKEWFIQTLGRPALEMGLEPLHVHDPACAKL